MTPGNSPKNVRHLTVALLRLCVLTASAGADHSFDINPHPSPEASTSLVCPNDNPLDCYPALFQPTIHFQKIRPNQSLPPGLHVRLNIQTGEKEARLNVPEEIEVNREAIVVIDIPDTETSKDLGIIEAEAPLHLRLQDEPKQKKHARPYAPPRSAAPTDPTEAVLYEASLSILKQGSSVIQHEGAINNRDTADALETLTELAHSLEWGLAICRDADLSRVLLATITTPATWAEDSNEGSRSAVLLLLATAVQNNPAALSALLEHSDEENGYQGPLHATLVSLTLDSNREGADLNTIARAVFFLSQLCTDDSVLQAYLTTVPSPDAAGFTQLQRLFSDSLLTKDATQQKIRHRIANFVEDHSQQIAALFSEGEYQTREVMTREIQTTLNPWCEALAKATQKCEEEDLVGVLEAKSEVDRVLIGYTGKGCGDGVGLDAPKEL